MLPHSFDARLLSARKGKQTFDQVQHALGLFRHLLQCFPQLVR